jgi:hypothetical protein
MQAGAGDSQASILGGLPPGEVLTATAVIATACIEAVAPDDKGAKLLQALGLDALTRDAEQSGGEDV